MRLSRFRPRRLTALVVILAMLLVAEEVVRRTGEEYRQRAAESARQAASVARLRDMVEAHASSEAMCRRMIPICASQARALRETDAAASNRLQESARQYAEQAAYHARMRKTYEAAISDPYLWVNFPPRSQRSL